MWSLFRHKKSSNTPAKTVQRNQAKIRNGQLGQDIAERYLLKQGLKLIERNVRWHDKGYRGEIDLIMTDKKTLVFVEVKSRRSTQFGSAVSAVGPAKQKQLSRLAMRYLHEKASFDREARFDVIGITFSDSSAPIIDWISNAFDLIS